MKIQLTEFFYSVNWLHLFRQLNFQFKEGTDKSLYSETATLHIKPDPYGKVYPDRPVTPVDSQTEFNWFENLWFLSFGFLVDSKKTKRTSAKGGNRAKKPMDLQSVIKSFYLIGGIKKYLV